MNRSNCTTLSFIFFLYLLVIPFSINAEQVDLLKVLPPPHAISKQELTELRQASIPLSGYQPGLKDKDLAPLGTLIGNAKVVGLGEATHGTHEFQLMKHRLLEYLVKKKGFTVFAVEANMPEANLLNSYVLEGKGNPKELLKGLYFWTLNTQEFLNMVEWMKEYNKTAKAKLQFAGFDMQYVDSSASIIKDFLKKSGDISELKEVDEIIKDLNKLESAKNKNYLEFVNNFQRSPDDYFNLLLRIHDVQRHISANPKNTAPKEFDWAIQNIRIIEQKTQSLIDTTERDRAMAENIIWLSHENPNAKLVIWAHNDHIKRFDQSYISMGKHLSNTFGNQYKIIAFTTLQGTYTAMSGSDSNGATLRRDIVIPSPKAGTLEDIINELNEPKVLINLAGVHQTMRPQFLTKPILWLNVGAFQVQNPRALQNINLGFDAVVFIKQTSASQAYI